MGTSVACVVRTCADEPAEVFDTYGRLVGDVHVRRPKLVDVNHWLVERGWALPALYSSMLTEEVDALCDLAARARRARRGVWENVAPRLGFDWYRHYRGAHVAVDREQDVGPVVFPKLFRRYATWKVNARARMVDGSFGAYLREHPGGCYDTTAFLDQGVTAAPHRRLDEFVRSDGRVVADAHALVFQEAPSDVIGRAGATLRW